MARFCIYCGTEGTPDNPIVNGVCLRCRVRRGEIVDLKNSRIRVDFCKSCGSIRIGFKWIDAGSFEAAIDHIVRGLCPSLIKSSEYTRDVRISGYELVTEASWRTIVRLNIEGLYGNVRFNVKKDLEIYLNPVKCPRCIMYDSREFNAVVQVRGFKKNEVKAVVDKILSSDQRIYRDLIDIIEGDEGMDFYFYSYGAARKFARRITSALKGSIGESFEYAGMRSGRRRMRLYISIKPT